MLLNYQICQTNFFSIVVSHPKHQIMFYLKWHALLSKIPILQNSNNNVLHDFQQVVFHTQSTIFFHNIQILIVTTVEVYKFHALIIRNKEKILEWSYNVIASKLRCDNFKLPKSALLAFLSKTNSHVNRLYVNRLIDPRDQEILGWCPGGIVSSHGEGDPL